MVLDYGGLSCGFILASELKFRFKFGYRYRLSRPPWELWELRTLKQIQAWMTFLSRCSLLVGHILLMLTSATNLGRVY